MRCLSYIYAILPFVIFGPLGNAEMTQQPLNNESILLRAINDTNATAVLSILSNTSMPVMSVITNGVALHFASKISSPEIVKILVRYGSSPNMQDAEGRTPLHHATSRNNVSMVEALLSLGADVNALDVYGSTPLHYAGSRSIAIILVKNGAHIWARDKAGLSSIHHALFYKDKDLLEYLLDNSIDRDAFVAVATDNLELLLALQKGKYPALNSLRFGLSGETLLHIAVRWEAIRCLRFLVDNYRDLLLVKDIDGKTPQDTAKFAKQEAIQKLVGSNNGNSSGGK